jgi:hypothetical protein
MALRGAMRTRQHLCRVRTSRGTAITTDSGITLPVPTQMTGGDPCTGGERISKHATCNARCPGLLFVGTHRGCEGRRSCGGWEEKQGCDTRYATSAEFHASIVPLVQIGEISWHWQRQRSRQLRRRRAQLQRCSRNGRAGSVALPGATPSQGDAAPPCQNRRLITGIQL